MRISRNPNSLKELHAAVPGATARHTIPMDVSEAQPRRIRSSEQRLREPCSFTIVKQTSPQNRGGFHRPCGAIAGARRCMAAPVARSKVYTSSP
jgi:hypothetical protein